MKAITIWQPWATLIVCGLKRYETRSWPTHYRGPLIIHASKKWNAELAAECGRVTALLNESTWTPLNLSENQLRLFYLPMGETLGKAIGIVDLTDSREMPDGGSKFENDVGWFGPGRFGWQCDSPVAFSECVQVKGKQGLWNPPAAVIQAAVF